MRTVRLLALLLLAACHRNGESGGDGYDLSAAADLSMGLVVTPASATLKISPTQPLATQAFTATLDGVPVTATWATDRAELGSIGNDGVYKTVGTFGGQATVQATYNGLTGSAIVTVAYADVGENGDPACTNLADSAFGTGGYGGVGGAGPGCTSSATQQATLATTPLTDSTISWLYPYDATVFPRGQLAPLLQWSPGTHTFDSLRLMMTSKAGTYSYDGTFGKPTGSPSFPATGPFQNMPIPQAVWQTMNLSASGDEVTITVILGEGAKAYAITPVKWIIAPGELRGVVYYNSYGTSLVTNSGNNPDPNMGQVDFNGHEFGAGELSIHAGDTNPRLVAGQNSTDISGCRVCHSVTRDGSRLATQIGPNYQTTKLVDLKNNNVESDIAAGGSAFPGLYPDGSLMFTSAGALLYGDTASRLYALPAGTLVASPPGLPADLMADMPSFAADGTALAFNWYGGGGGGDKVTIASMTFDAKTSTFGAITKLVTPANGYPAVWPSFLPSNNGVVYEVETKSNEFGFTRSGVEAHLEWVDVATKTSMPLASLNGGTYLPTGASHADDTKYNYEPTVNPVPSGGYAWVVFTSRRMYGNVATQDPFLSDPRGYDWTKGVTTKKLWVAAIDLSAKAGTDPSHPAFYLPAQELHAGNSRGFWTVDPCAADGQACQTGDQCCGGFCSPESTDGGTSSDYVCGSTKATCSNLYEKCTTTADCCPPAPSIDPGSQAAPTCINGYCSVSTPPIL